MIPIFNNTFSQKDTFPKKNFNTAPKNNTKYFTTAVIFAGIGFAMYKKIGYKTINIITKEGTKHTVHVVPKSVINKEFFKNMNMKN